MVGLFVIGAAGVGEGVGTIGLFGLGLGAMGETTGVGISVIGTGSGAMAGEVDAVLPAVVAATGVIGAGAGVGGRAMVKIGFVEFKIELFAGGVMLGIGVEAGIIGALDVGDCGATGVPVDAAAVVL